MVFVQAKERKTTFSFTILLSQSNRWLHYGAGDITTFDIFSGVRQACVLSSRLVCAALELAMSDWRLANPQGGMDLGRYASFAWFAFCRWRPDLANTKQRVREWEWDLHAKIGSLFRAQASTTNDIYISRSSGVSERKKIIELAHPRRNVLGTFSPVSNLFVPAEVLNHRIPCVSRPSNSSSVFWEPIHCTHKPIAPLAS